MCTAQTYEARDSNCWLCNSFLNGLIFLCFLSLHTLGEGGIGRLPYMANAMSRAAKPQVTLEWRQNDGTEGQSCLVPQLHVLPTWRKFLWRFVSRVSGKEGKNIPKYLIHAEDTARCLRNMAYRLHVVFATSSETEVSASGSHGDANYCWLTGMSQECIETNILWRSLSWNASGIATIFV